MSSLVDEQQVFDIVSAALARVLEIDRRTITPQTSLSADLRADSLALVETVEIVESQVRQFSPAFEIDDDDVEDLETVEQAVAYVLARL